MFESFLTFVSLYNQYNSLYKMFCPQCDMKTYSAVSLLRRRSLPGEEDEFRAVLLQTLHVGLERLCGLVAAARVNWDANCAGCLFVDASCLQVQTTKSVKTSWRGKNKVPNLAVTIRLTLEASSHQIIGFNVFIKKIQRFRRFVILWLQNTCRSEYLIYLYHCCWLLHAGF